MQEQRVLISGAGIAGPAAAYWLARFGYRPTVVERARALRAGGQAVDFRGPAHLGVLARMGILDEIRRQESRGGHVSFVDGHGRPVVTMSDEVASGDVEILRGDLGRVLFDATADSTEYVFGDSITGLEELPDGVHVTFQRHEPRVFDLVIGADGLHSAVRALAFGPDSEYLRHLDYYVAVSSATAAPGAKPGGMLYSVPGRTAGVFTHKGHARTIFYFASPEIAYDRRDIGAQQRIVAERFKGMGWETPRLVTEMLAASDFYFDAIGEVRMNAYSKGRVALLGDAGYGGTIGGMGTGLAVVAAYILAGELAVARGDYAMAFARYEQRIRGYAEQCQRGARRVGGFMAPKTSAGIWFRDHMLRAAYLMPGRGMMEKIALKRASAVTFGDYPA